MSLFFRLRSWISSIFKPLHRQERIGKVLCVDDDLDFCRYLERLGRLMGIKMDKALTLAEAKQKIEANPDYQAYIVDGHLPDGSGFDLAKMIRETKGEDVPIGFVSRFYQDAASFRLLREILKVDYVLEKPIRPEDVEKFLVRLCRIEDSEHHVAEKFPDEVMIDLKKEYEKGVGEKIEHLEKLILALQKNPKIEQFIALKTEVHKIAGSAGSYGYKTVSTLCKKLDDELKLLIEDPSFLKKVNSEWLNSLDEFYSKIKLHFQMNGDF